jgi:phenylalanyl-tRNA synthetase alpha chain
MTDLNTLQTTLLSAITAAPDLTALEAVRVEALGKKGSVTALFNTLGSLPAEDRKAQGAVFNTLKEAITTALNTRKETLEAAALTAQLAAEAVDVSLPPLPLPKGTLHPITRVMEEVTAIFARQGFTVEVGPDIEDDFHNFTALNIPPEHPARQMHDTFYLEATSENGASQLLRTHTSPVQIRTLKEKQPPLRMLAMGRTFRCDSDMTHTPMFHQIEGLVIEEGVHFGHLKGTIENFLAEFFEIDDLKVRFRPSFFPFTEPSAEVDIGCKKSKESLQIGIGDDWLEILGCGMVHPNVLKAAGVDPATHQGFAFGMGVERLAMLKYGIPDLRAFFASDLRWLRHYGFSAFEGAV